MNLSKTQQDVLLRMADGARLLLRKGMYAYFSLKDQDMSTVRWPTAQALKHQGAIEVKTEDWKSAEYILTDAGREEASRIREIQKEDL